MKLIEDSRYAVTVEISEANLRAMLADFESRGSTEIVKRDQGVVLSVRVKRDADHYTERELSDRMSPYLPPEAWAGVVTPDYDRLYPTNNESE